MMCGLSGDESVTVIDPLLVPAAVGVKVTTMLQAAPAASLAPQLLVSAKSPLAAMLLMLKLAVPLFVTVTFWLTLVVFRA